MNARSRKLIRAAMVLLIATTLLILTACDTALPANPTPPTSVQQTSAPTNTTVPTQETIQEKSESSVPANVDFSPSSEWANAIRQTVLSGLITPQNRVECEATYGQWYTIPTKDGSIGQKTCSFNLDELHLSPQEGARKIKQEDTQLFNEMLAECQGRDPEFRCYYMVPPVGCRDLNEVAVED